MANGQHQHDHDEHDAVDPHIWLSPHNVRIAAEAIANSLMTMDSSNATLYQANLQRFVSRIDSLQTNLHQQ